MENIQGHTLRSLEGKAIANKVGIAIPTDSKANAPDFVLKS